MQNGTAYFGGLIGRVANRVAGARFTLDGKAYRLYPNDGNNSLHGERLPAETETLLMDCCSELLCDC